MPPLCCAPITLKLSSRKVTYMNNVVQLNAPVKQLRRGTYIPPEHLHEYLEPTLTRVITFRSEKALQSYRRMLYTVNRQGQFRYRTIRDEQSSFGLVIWRMK